MSEAAASSQSGEKPKAAIEPSSTTLPAVLRFSSSSASGSPAGALPLDAPDQLDRDPEQVLGGRLVQPRAPREPRQHDLGRLVHRAAEPGDERPQRPLRKRDEKGPVARHGYDDSMVVTGTLETLLRDSFPDASELAVEDRTGGGDHFQVTVASGRFDGLSLVEQHRLVYEALAEPLADGSIHELRIKTRGIA